MKKGTLPTNNNHLSLRQSVVNESAMGFALHFKRGFASLMLTMLSLLFVGNAISQTTVTWPLSANTTPSSTSGTGYTAANQSVVGFFNAGNSYTGFNMSGVQGAQRASGTASGTATTMPGTSINTGYYTQYSITAASPYSLSVSQINMDLAGGGTSSIKATIQYSLDGFTTNKQLVSAASLPTNASSAGTSNTLTTFTYTSTNFTGSVNIPVPAGTTLSIRVYAWNSSTGTGKYLISSNVQVTFTASSSAATYYWNGNNATNLTTSNLWDNNTSKNWSTTSSGTFTSGNGAVWPASGTNDAYFNNTASGATSVTIAGNPIAVAPNNINIGAAYTFNTTSGTGAGSLASTIALGSNTLTTAPVSGSNLTLSGIISGTGGITQNGTGTTTLSAANTYTGGTTLTAGTLAINNAAALGASTGTFTINGGSIDNTTAGTLTTGNYPQSWGGNFTFVGSQPLNLGTGAVTLTGSSTVTTTASTLTVGGVIGGAFNLTKAGSGTLLLTGTNTLTGTGSGSTINVTGGTLQLNKTGGTTIPAGTSVAVGSGATLQISSNQSIGNLDLTGGGTVVVDAGITLTITGTYTPGTGATITNNGTINLNSSGISFPGSSTTTSTFNSLTVSANATLDNNLTLGSAGVLTFSGSSIITNTGFTLTLSNTSTSAIVSSSSTAYVSGGSLRLTFLASQTNTNYTYPLGAGGAYLPFILRVSTNGTAGSAAIVKAFNGSFSPVAGTLTPSTTEYWSVTTATGNANGATTGANLTALAAYAAKATLGTNNSIGVNTTGSTGTYNSIGGAPATVGGISGVGPTSGAITASPGNAGTFYLALGFAGTNYYWNGTNAANNTTGNTWDNGTSLNWATPINGTFNSGAGSAWSNTGTNIANFANTASGANTVNVVGALTPYSTVLGTNYTLATTSGGGSSSISGPIDLGTNTLTTAPVSSANLTLSGVIGNGSLTQNGTGTTIISGANALTGGVSITAGTLQLGSNTALNSTTPNTVTFTSGSTGKLQLNGNSVSVGGLITNSTVGTPIIENGAGGNTTLTISSTGNNVFAGTIQNGSTGTLAIINNGSGTVALNGNNTNTGGLTTSGTGTLTLGGSNTFSGVTIGAGTTININNPAALGSGTVSPNSGCIIDNTSGAPITLTTNNNFASLGSSLTFTGSNSLNLGTGNYTLVAGHTLTANGSSTLTIGGVISDGGAGKGFGKAGTGTVVLSGANTNTGIYTVSAGTLKLGASSSSTAGPLGSATSATVNSGGILDLNGYSLTTGTNITTLNINGTGALINGSTSSSTYSGTVSLQGSTNSIVSNAGGGDINLTGASGSTAGTAISGISSTKLLVLDGSGTNSTVSGIIAGTSSVVTKTGTGTWTLSGANTYTGATTVTQGALVVGAAVASGAASPVGNASSAVVVGDANTPVGSNVSLLIGGPYTFARTLSIANANTSANYEIGGSTDNNATFSGNITLTNKGVNISQVATSGSNALTISGIISNSHGITKTGAGKVILTGANTFTGSIPVTVTSGTLVLNHTGGTTIVSGNRCDIATAGTLQISKDQTLGIVNLSGNGSLIIDANTTLTVTGLLTMASGSTIINNGTLILQGGATGFPGSASSTFTNLSISGTGITLNNSVSVTGLLTLTGVNITLGANNLTLTQANAISGTGKIVTNSTGDVIVAFPSGATAYTLPLSPNGTSSEPVTLTKTGTGTQTYTVSVGTIAFAQSDALNYSWTISTNNGSASVATNIALGWGTADATGDLNATPAIGGVLQYVSGAWVYSSGGTIVSSSNTTTLSAVTDFSNSSFTVGKPPLQAEPTNYPTSFTASATSSNQGQVTLTWNDATGSQLPSGYLIKGSTVGFNSISAPVDGTPVATSGLNFNYGYSLETATITGLTENTTYYFKIYPYTNSGVDIDYKTSATAPQVAGTTTNVTNVVTDVFRSRISGNWGTPSTWESYDGHSWITASAAPNATSTGGITIQNGHTVSVAATVSASKITINPTGNITVTVGDTLTVNHTAGSSADITVAGTLKNQGRILLGSGALMTVAGTGTYQHDVDSASAVIPTATWAVGSTLNITGVVASNPSALLTGNSAFYNIIWNCPSQTALCGPLFSAGATPVTNYHVYGNFSVNSTGSSSGLKMLGLLANQSVVLTVDGNFSVSSSTLQTNGSGTTPTGTPGFGIYNIGGDFTVGSGSTFYFNNGTGNSSCVINMLNGNFSNAGTLRTRTVASDSAAIVFKKAGTQTLTNSGTFISGLTNTVVSVNAGTTLNIASAVTVPALNVASGGTVSNSSTLTVSSTLTAPALSSLTNNGTISGAGVITLTGASQTISGTGTINNLTLNNSTGTTISSGRQSITGILKVTAGTFNMGSNLLTLKSTSIANSAVVDQVGGTITGTATVERFIPAGFRAYRDMAPQVYGAGSMYNNWQSAGAMSSGSGIFITGPGATNATVGDYASGQIAPSSAGLDYSINGIASAFMYTSSSATWNTGITNTTTTNLDPFLGYRVLVRGDRNFNLATTPIVNYYGLGLRMVNATTLKATGNLVYGTVTYNTTNASGNANGGAVTSSSAALNNSVGAFSMVSNPYVCPVQWGTGTATNSTTATVYGASGNINGSYWYMDPTHGAGTYAAYNALTGSVYAGNTASAFIQPGQAFFVQTSATNPTVVFKETAKASGSTKTAVFGIATTLSKIYVSINKLNSTTGNQERVDGAAIAFSEGFTNSVYGPQDALKFANTNDNLSISDKGKSLSIDGRLPATASDKIQLEISKVSGTSYQLIVEASSYLSNGLEPYIVDAYRGTTVTLNNGSNTINFTVDASLAASYTNRFSIAFKPTTLAVNSIVASANLNNKIATISWNTVGEKGVSRFEVEKSTDAKSFVKIGQSTAKNTATATYTTTDNSVTATTYYRVKAISEVGTVSYSNVAKLSAGNSSLSSYSLYPNPLKGSKVVNVSLTNVAAGKYTVTINNVLGQRVQEVAISHAGGNGSHAITVNSTLATGTYSLTIRETSSGQIVHQSNLSVN